MEIETRSVAASPMEQQPNIDILNTEHQDFIHDLAFDHFGRRLATCSSDQTVKIWQKTDSGKWVKACSFQAHDATIFKVKWAHPDHGSILASCSYDKSVIIWEEKKKSVTTAKSVVNSMHSETDEYATVFVQRTKLVDSKESIEDIKFAPKHLNLMIASASADGYLRIYECPDLINLAQWKLNFEVQVNSLGINSISWNKNPFNSPMIAIGSKDKNTSFVSGNVMRQQNLEHVSQVTFENTVAPINEDKFLSIYICKDNRWNLLGELKSDDKRHLSAVNDVSWALLNGRSYHIIASCGKEGVFIWYVKFEDDPNKNIKMEVVEAQWVRDNVSVWKVSWNVMATLLAFSGQDNKVRICKCGYDKKWMIATEFEDEEIEEEEHKRVLGFGEKRIF